jgi:hypothetical protein
MNGATREDTRNGLDPTDYVNQAGVWVPQTSVAAPAPSQPAPPRPPAAAPAAPARPARDATAPGPVVEQGGQVVTVGTGNGQLSAATGLAPVSAPAVRPPAPAPARRRGWRLPAATSVSEDLPEELPDGVLGRISNGMAAAIGAVALVGMAEAAFNLGRFVFAILHLPLPLAIGFPAIFEIAAATFAIQDARDRRQGADSLGLRVATYLTLVASSAINGIVGFASHGLAGLIEIVPPLMLAGVIHLHGDRATRAYQSRAVLRPAWREAQLKAARRDSVIAILPLLLGDDEHAKATVASLSHLLTSGNLEPSEALLAAGWFDRFDRDMSPSMLLRLETVAATVWGSTGPPNPSEPTHLYSGVKALPPPAPRRSRAAAGTTAGGIGPSGTSSSRPAGSSTGSTRGSSSGPSNHPTGTTGGTTGGTTSGSTRGSATSPPTGTTGSPRTTQQLRARTFEDLIAELESAVAAGHLSADSSPRAIRDELKVNANRAVALHSHLLQITGTAPHSPDQQPSPAQAGAGAAATDAEGAL